jgi:hypothetical protein
VTSKAENVEDGIKAHSILKDHDKVAISLK